MTNTTPQTHLTTDSNLANLPLHNFQVSPTLPAGEVDAIFRERTDIPGVLIIEHHHLLGLISRREFFEQLGQLYGPAIYLKRPIAAMLNAIRYEWLQLPVSTRIHEATQQVFNRPAHGVYEPIVVELNHQGYSVLDVRILLMAQTNLLANLQKELKQTNDDLEVRVKARTAELTQINRNLEAEIIRRKRVEEALTLARDQALQSSQLKTELLAKVNHELRTPLGAILGYVEMLEVGIYGPVSPEQKEVTAKIFKSGQDLNQMVNELLDEAQLAAGKFRLNMGAFTPREMIENVLAQMNILAQKKNLKLTADIAPEIPPWLIGDSTRLQQILVNLVSNALKFTEHGTVQVRFYLPNSTQWAIQVTDTGCGIPLEEQPYIFEPFRQVDGSITRQHNGTGLGLTIVKQLTELMNGKINVTSKVGQGSTFTVFLPLTVVEKKAYA